MGYAPSSEISANIQLGFPLLYLMLHSLDKEAVLLTEHTKLRTLRGRT